MAKSSLKQFYCPRHWTLRQRLDHHSIPEPNSGCLLWLGAGAGRPDNLYPSLWMNGVKLRAHKASWEEANGQTMAPGLFACHKCDVKMCIEPTHIFPGTHQDNVDDMVSKGLQQRGTSHWHAQLTEDQVRQIRADPRGHVDVARAFGVTAPAVFRLRKRLTWKHVD